VATNAPRILRHAFYYSYLSHTPRYYQVVRNGKHGEVFPIADILREKCPQGMLVATDAHEVRLFHFLSGRRIAPLPDVPRQSPDDADFIVNFALSNQQLAFVVLDIREVSESFRKHVASTFVRSRQMQLVHRGNHYVVYQRI